jgi:YVTN family beta-propeller protein
VITDHRRAPRVRHARPSRPLAQLAVIATALCALAAVASAQWLEKVIYLPDSLSGVIWPSCLALNPDAHMIYVSGSYDDRTRSGLDAYVMVLDAHTTEKVARIAVQENVASLCYNPVVHKLYASHPFNGRTSVIDGFSNNVSSTVEFDAEPTLLCCNTVNGKMYVSSHLTDNSMAILDGDGDSVIRKVPVTGNQWGLAFDSIGNKVYCSRVALQTGAAILVVDGVGDSALRELPIEVDPVDMAVSASHRRLYCYGWGGGYEGALVIVDTDGDTILKTIRAGPGGSEDGQVLCVNERRGEVYFPGVGDTVLVIDCSGDSVVRRLTLGDGYEPSALRCLPEQDLLFCYAGNPDAAIRVVNLETGAVALTEKAKSRLHLLADPAEGRFYRTNYWDALVHVLTASGDSVSSSEIIVGSQPRALCLASRVNKLYAGDVGKGAVYVIDLASDRVRTVRLPGGGAGAMCYDSLDNKMYCTGGSEELHVLDCVSDSVVATVPTGYTPREMVYVPRHNRIYCANKDGGSLTVIDCRNDSVIRTVPVNIYAQNPMYNPQRDEVLVVCDNSPAWHFVAVVDCSTNTWVDTLRYDAYVPIYFEPLKKIYMVGWNSAAAVLDAETDSLVASIPWVSGLAGGVNETDNKVYTVWLGLAAETFVVEATADTVTSIITSIQNAISVTHDVLNDKVYIPSSNEPGMVVVLDGPTDSIVDSIPVLGHKPAIAVWNPADGRVYVSNYFSGSVSVIRDTVVPGIEDMVAVPRRHGGGTLTRQISLPAGMGRVDIFDISGRRVARLGPDAGRTGRLGVGVYFLAEPGKHGATKVTIVR